MEVTEALTRILAGSNLRYRRVNGGFVVSPQILPGRPAAAAAGILTQPARVGSDRVSGAASIEKVEEIVVTAQRRSENLQDVPITVAVLTDSTLNNSGALNTANLQLAVPGLVNTQTSNTFLPYIRGVGSSASGAGNESSVSVYIDGVYQGSKSGNLMELVNIERVEVLKGPQGTLFGRNATGGAINIITRDPLDVPEFSVEAGYGRFDEKRVRSYASTPLTDSLAVSAAFAGRWDNGYVRNLVTGRGQNPVSNETVTAKLVWKPSDVFTARLSAAYTHVSDPTFSADHVQPGTVSVAESRGFRVAHGPRDALLSIDESVQKISSWRGALNLAYDAGAVRLTSISGYNRSKMYTFGDSDVSAASIAQLSYGGFAEQFTQELQVSSIDPGPLEWVAGLYYIDFDDGHGGAPRDNSSQSGVPNPVRPTDLLLPGASVTAANSVVKTKSGSIFGQATYKISPRTRITLGLRYTAETKSVVGRSYRYVAVAGTPDSGVPLSNGVLQNDGLVFGTVPLASMDIRKTWKRLTWRAAIDHRFSDDLMGYASYSRGFKGGAYAPANVNPLQQPVNPETLDAFEVGFKSEWFDRRLRLNASAFYYDYKNIQLVLVSPEGRALLQNAASAQIHGLDADFVAVPARNLTIRGGVSLMDSKYKNYPNAQLYLPNVAETACSATPRNVTLSQAREIARGTPTGGNCAYSLIASGLDMIVSPTFTANLGGEYSLNIGDDGSRILLTGSLYHNSGYDLAPGGIFTHVDDYQSLAASITFFGPDDRYHIRLWGENLTNNLRSVSILPTPQAFREVNARPLSVGIAVGFKLGR